MLNKLGSMFIKGALAATVLSTPAFAQAVPKDVLPPGAQTIAVLALFPADWPP